MFFPSCEGASTRGGLVAPGRLNSYLCCFFLVRRLAVLPFNKEVHGIMTSRRGKTVGEGGGMLGSQVESYSCRHVCLLCKRSATSRCAFFVQQRNKKVPPNPRDSQNLNKKTHRLEVEKLILAGRHTLSFLFYYIIFRDSASADAITNAI